MASVVAADNVAHGGMPTADCRQLVASVVGAPINVVTTAGQSGLGLAKQEAVVCPPAQCVVGATTRATAAAFGGSGGCVDGIHTSTALEGIAHSPTGGRCHRAMASAAMPPMTAVAATASGAQASHDEAARGAATAAVAATLAAAMVTGTWS